MVVTRDGGEHGLGQFVTRASVSENLDIENQVHPQDGEQEPTASRQQRGHVLLFRSGAFLACSRVLDPLRHHGVAWCCQLRNAE
jgi:hypothetical protein